MSGLQCNKEWSVVMGAMIEIKRYLEVNLSGDRHCSNMEESDRYQISVMSHDSFLFLSYFCSSSAIGSFLYIQGKVETITEQVSCQKRMREDEEQVAAERKGMHD